jgi:hypothetical protein
MPQYLVITIEGDDVPADGGSGHAVVYRGTHADEAEAVNAAADVINVPDGKRLWCVPASALTRYRNTTTVQRSSAAE